MTRWPPRDSFERIFMTTGLWLSLAKNNDKMFMSTNLGLVLVKDGSREFSCLPVQITKINELILWPAQILAVVWYKECPAGYGKAERIDLPEPKVVRGILISKSEGLEWSPDWKRLDNFPVLEKSQGSAKSWLMEIGLSLLFWEYSLHSLRHRPDIGWNIFVKPSELSKERTRASGQIDLRHSSPSSPQKDREKDRERERKT